MVDTPGSSDRVPLTTKVAFLSRPEAYPEERPRRVEAVETHMSWVFLTDRHAYKLKKPVRLPLPRLQHPGGAAPRLRG